MNTKELISRLAKRTNLTPKEIDELLHATTSVAKDLLISGKSIGIQGFGTFEIRKKEERVSVHPATQIRTLIPPKLVVNFKQSTILKEKLNDNKQ